MKKEVADNCQKDVVVMCHVNGTSVFPSAPSKNQINDSTLFYQVGNMNN